MKKFILSLVVTCLSLSAMNHNSPYQAYLLGYYNLLEENGEEAFSCFQQVFKNSSSIWPYKGFVQLLQATSNSKAIIALMPKLKDPFKNDVQMQMIFGHALAENGNQQAADELFIQLANQHPTNQELTYFAATAYSKTNPLKAIEVIEQFLNAATMQPRNCIFYFLQSQLYMSLNNKEKAIEKVKKSLELCDRLDKGWLLLGVLQQQQGQLEAVDSYNRYLQLAGPDKKVEQEIQHLVAQSKLAQPTPRKLQPAHAPSCVANALSSYKQGNYEQALAACDQCLKAQPESQDARILKIHILSASNNPDKAVALLETYMSEQPDNQMWYTILHLIQHAGFDRNTIISLVQRVEQKHPKSLMPTLYLADFYSRHDTNAAIKYHNKALEKASDTELKTKILFNLAVIYFHNDQFKEMKTTLDKAQQYNTHFSPLHNLLAYYYATKGANISLAQHHIDLALKQDQNNPHFLDTKAVILYRQHEYDKAEQILTSIAKKAEKDYFIHFHLAKTYYKLGKTSQAYTTMQKSLTLALTQAQKAKCNYFLNQWQQNGTNS